MVSQHGTKVPTTNNNTKAAAILRASLSRRTDGGALHNSRHGPGSAGRPGRPPVAPTSTTAGGSGGTAPAFPDVHCAAADGDVEVSSAAAGAAGEEGLALTDSIHGPDGLVASSSSSHSRSRPSSRNSLVHSGHGDIESALPGLGLHAEQQRRRSSSAASLRALGSNVGRKLSAATLVRQVSGASAGNLRDVDLSSSGSVHAPTDHRGNPNLLAAAAASSGGGGGGSPTSAAHFPVSASSPGRDGLDKSSYDTDHAYHPGHDRHNSCLIRFLHTRWMQVAAAVAVACVVGAVAVGAAVGGQRNGGGAAAAAAAAPSSPSSPPADKKSEWEKWEAEQNYDDGDKYEVVDEDMDMVPIGQRPQQGEDQQQQQQQEQEQDDETGTTEYVSSTGAKPGTWITGGGGGGSTTTATTETETHGTPIWLSATHFADPALATVGSAVSFSSDGYHLAISSAQSSTVQIYRLNLAEGRNWTPLGGPLPGKVASMSGDGRKVAVADSTESTVTTYRYVPSTDSWSVYGTRIIDIWGARSVSLSDDGSALAVAHYPDAICRICPSVASVFELMDFGAQGQWVQEYDVLGAYDFDFSIELSGDGSTLVFSGRVYENALGSGQWQVKDAFPDFISSHSALSGDGRTAAVSLPDCHIFKNADPTLTGCTNTEAREVSVMEYRDSAAGGGWWNRKGISIGPASDGAAGTTALALSEDGNTVAVAAGGAGYGGEAALGGAVGGFAGGAEGTSIPTDAARGPPLRRRRLQDQEQEQERLDDSNEDFWGYDAYDVEEAYVRVYRYDDATGDWHIVGEDIVLDASGATLALSADGHRLAVGSPYGGTDERGYVKIYDLVMQ